ncbi:hypothetical protein Fmac_014779 [Flemingia macrophylla]|uniref:Cyclin-dependent kinase inhibitor domain-containing protein n=1 Tax=Flemingia macrophylla TaxID=520843 RepID=A0ABD1MCP8_9FABA
MDMAQVKTRARTALSMEASATSPKRRKIAAVVQLTSFTTATVQRFSADSPASCCSTNEIKFSDLEVESSQVETSTCNYGEQQQISSRRREMSLSSELRSSNSQEVDSTEKNPPMMQTKTKSRSALSTPQKMPTESELEEFFSSAEKNIQKRFSEKYNYDIVKDVPLEGRYEWLKLKP